MQGEYQVEMNQYQPKVGYGLGEGLKRANISQRLIWVSINWAPFHNQYG